MDGAAPRSLSATELQAWTGLLEVSQRLLHEVDAELKQAHGVSLGDCDLLAQLAAAPEARMRMADLAEAVPLTPSGLTRQVDRLEQRGLVERLRCPSDGRGLWAGLTGPGRELLDDARRTREAGIDRRFLEPLSAGDVKRLAAIWNLL